jgi:hypothetical protein
MDIVHVGLEISDDAIRCLQYTSPTHGRKIAKFASVKLDNHIVRGGDIADEKSFIEILSKFSHDNDLSYVKVSVPEEKAYLFQTDVPDADLYKISQNIEFKLEENVPLTAADAVFYFDILPISVTGGALRASVSVVPRVYIEHILQLLRGLGISPMGFEVVPKAIARAIIPLYSENTIMIIHIMNEKTGVYIVSGGVVCFTSTIGWGSCTTEAGNIGDVNILAKEINRIHNYWMSHSVVNSQIEKAMLVGSGILPYENTLKKAFSEFGLNSSVANVWENAFSIDKYIPPISMEDSLDYAVVAGLAMDL